MSTGALQGLVEQSGGEVYRRQIEFRQRLMDEAVILKPDRQPIEPHVFVQVDADVIGFARFDDSCFLPGRNSRAPCVLYFLGHGNTSNLDVKPA